MQKYRTYEKRWWLSDACIFHSWFPKHDVIRFGLFRKCVNTSRAPSIPWLNHAKCFLVAGQQPDDKFVVFGQCLFIIRGGNKGDCIYQNECIVELKGTRIFNLVRGQVYGDIRTLFFRECDG